MKHTQLVILALNLAVLPLSPVTPLDAAERVKPNVLFIMADDLRAELASYGSPAVTPNLVRLARKCVQFDRAYCQQAVCNPSRSSLLTGRRPDTLQVWNNSTHFRERNPDITTIPLWFKEHGYTTRCVGKIFHNWHTKVQDRPFFLAVGFWRPHAQFNAPKRFWDLYDRAKLPRLDPRRPVGAPEIAFHQSTEILGPVANQKKPTPQQAAEMRHGYFANISYMDAQLGKVLDGLEKSGVADRTIVTFTQHPRPAYYDRTPSQTPMAMGVSVRTAKARYTEWRDWRTGEIVGRELYADVDEPAETRSLIDEPVAADIQREAERSLRKQFPLVKAKRQVHPGD